LDKTLERETGIEPATNGLGSRYSTIEPATLPLSYSRQFLDYMHAGIDYGYGFFLARGQGYSGKLRAHEKVWDGWRQIGLG
jgi:hypothetical protein